MMPVIMQRQFLLVLVLLAVVVFSLSLVVPGLAYADINDLRHGHWSGGAGIGFLGNTPDGAAEFGLNGHADYFFTPNVSPPTSLEFFSFQYPMTGVYTASRTQGTAGGSARSPVRRNR
jgi:hypothetical protein